MPMGGASVFAGEFESAEQVITSGGLLTIAHGLGRQPKDIRAVAVCKVAEFGYSVDDVLFIEKGISDGGSASISPGFSTRADADNIYVRFGANAKVLFLNNNTTGGIQEFTNTSWRVKWRAFA